MTEAARRPTAGTLVVSPAAAALLALTTTWALHHRPEPDAPPAPRHASATTGATVRLRSDLAAAAADLQRTQASALRLGGAVRGRTDRLRVLSARVRSIGSGRPGGPAPAAGGGASTQAAGPPPAPAAVPAAVPAVPAAVPAAPPVSTSTGAS